jgi:hypothetical protein
MNGSLSRNIAQKLMPALERSQGVEGSYVRAGQVQRLRVIPTSPDWEAEDDRGTVIEEFTELVFIAGASDFGFLGLGTPQQSDRLTVILADGVARTYALLAKKGVRPWSLDATGSNYFLRMKWVKA